MDIGDNDNDRVLGLASGGFAVAPATTSVVNEYGAEGEMEEYLDLGPPSDHDEEADGSGGESQSERGIDKGDVGDGNVKSFSDNELIGIESKKEAKALGKELYKRWKKLQRREKKEKRHHHEGKTKRKSKRDSKERKNKNRDNGKRRRKDNDDDEDDDMNDHDGGKTVFGRRKQKRSRGEKPLALGDEDLGAAPFADIDEVLRVEEEAAARQTKKRGVKELQTGLKPKKLTVEAQRDVFRSIAAGVVNAMREARLKDEVDANECRPPLHRVDIREYVMAQCRREVLRSYLIEEGILQELSTWLYDFSSSELAAYELRSDALDILLSFPIEGELDAGVARNGDEILDAFTGITRDHLINTDLGSAVNAVRQSEREVHQNRAKAVRLLERLSRAMAGGVRTSHRRGGGGGNRASHASGGFPNIVTWKCKDDPTVMPPFHAVRTGTEVFQSALARPDPLDPLSYLHVPPRRAPKAYVTNLGGNVTSTE